MASNLDSRQGQIAALDQMNADLAAMAVAIERLIKGYGDFGGQGVIDELEIYQDALADASSAIEKAQRVANNFIGE